MFKRVVLAVTLILALGLLWSGCSRDEQSPVVPDNPEQGVPLLDPSVRAAANVQEEYTPAFMAMPNVVGTAVGMTDDGKLCMLILTAEALAKDALPRDVAGLPVVEEVTGIIRPMAVSHTAKQTPPIQLGTSGGWRYDLANGYCCGGTLGSLVTDGTKQYVMSNYHVLEADIVAGGNSRTVQAGDYVIQPGLIDVSCNAANAQNVATMVIKRSLPSSNVDVAIAEVIPGMVSTTGAILEIGTISRTTIAPALNMAVKKSGRTSGLTRSKISGLNATISVQYENECAGGVAFTKTFTGQIVISNRASKFLKGGDSGSLMVQDVATNPKAVGLLFAGSTSTAIANPIGQVLSFLGNNFTMVGN
jgi:hypothetical protein